MSKKRDLTVAEYLCHMGQAVLEANINAMQVERDLLVNNELDAIISLGRRKVKMRGASVLPEGYFTLKQLELECESAVVVARDDEGEPIGLAMTMTKGLVKRKMHVKFRATFEKQGTVEAFEILRDTANNDMRNEIDQGGDLTDALKRAEDD